MEFKIYYLQAISQALGCDYGASATTTAELELSNTESTTSSTTAETDSYSFVLPDNVAIWTDYDVSGEIKFSTSCIPDWTDSVSVDCAWYATAYDGQWCTLPSMLIYYAKENAEGIWETALQCPQCGCGADGAVNLNDL